MAVVDSRACPPVEAGGRTDARSLRSAASHAGGREPRFVVAGWRVRSAAPKAAAAPTDATLASSNRRATGRGDLSWPAMTPCTISSVEHAARCSKPAARSVGEDAPRTHEQHLSSRPTPCAGSRPLGGWYPLYRPQGYERPHPAAWLPPLYEQFASRFLHRDLPTRRFWQGVLRVLTYTYTDAERLDTDRAIVPACTALETLGWSILVVQEEESPQMRVGSGGASSMPPQQRNSIEINAPGEWKP